MTVSQIKDALQGIPNLPVRIFNLGNMHEHDMVQYDSYRGCFERMTTGILWEHLRITSKEKGADWIPHYNESVVKDVVVHNDVLIIVLE